MSVQMVKVYKLGTVHEVDPTAVDIMLSRGFALDPDTPAPIGPVLDLSAHDNAKLLHLAAVSNVEVPPDADREAIVTLLIAYWTGLGSPEGWLEAALAAPAPVPPEELEIPTVIDEDVVPVEVDELELPNTHDEETVTE